MNNTSETSVLDTEVPGRGTTAWWDYVDSIAGSDTLSQIAKRSGVSSTTIPRWRRTSRRVDAGDVIAFARGYDRCPLEALIAAGYITEDEADAWATHKA